MTTTAKPTPTLPPQRHLPAALYFPGDELAKKMVGACARFYRSSVEGVDLFHGTNVIVTTDERALLEFQRTTRSANVRVIAISDMRFHDPRADGAVYAYLPRSAGYPLLERMIDNAIDHMNLLTTRQEAHERLALATHEINELNRIGAALSAEHDTGKLLELILLKCREITKADAGSLYLVEEQETDNPEADENTSPEGRKVIQKILRFKLAQNDTAAVPFREIVIPINESSIAGYVARNGETVLIEDAYHLPIGVPYNVNRRFDLDSGYRTKSILALPMRNPKDEIVGVVQLINAKRDYMSKLDTLERVTREVIPFSSRQKDIVSSLASQAAVAYENSQLYESIQRLFEGFVKAAVVAIESRDPTTSGHSFRVANLTVSLAEAVDRDTKIFNEINFTREQMREIRYASLLHDFGKVGVREQVLVKANKLYPEQLQLVRQRFDFVRRTIESENTRARLDYILEKGREEYLANQSKFDDDLMRRLTELDRHLQTILTSNEPTVLPEGNFQHLINIAARHYIGWDGDSNPLLTDDEVRLLSIRKGSLDDQERLEIESHVVHTYNFLKQIPWTREIRNIPQIARGHHEKLNGLGYPFKLSAPEIPVQTRMMTVSDIFDALSAADRPYKKAVSREAALDILGDMVKDGEVDNQVYDIFVEAKIYERSNVESLPY
jgi:HD-GYP domain-containing protein (c-di-GMP phosphodiesterase class II)